MTHPVNYAIIELRVEERPSAALSGRTCDRTSHKFLSLISYVASRTDTTEKGANMDVGMVTTFISNVGFPIAACIALYVLVQNMQKAHKEEIDSLRKTIEQNTVVLVRLESIIKMLDRRTDGEEN